MGRIEINANVYQEIVYRSVCEFLGLEDAENTMNFKKSNIIVEKFQPSEDEDKERVKFTVQVPARFESNFIEYANNIACHVKSKVEEITGMFVECVNIRVADVINE
ncbi:Uncharacterized conserved protein YloU, alkaline shock protein (Asp23) family [Fervidobacterium changbaicum]|uniref:Asp23/Gls24 family envelope stress response protein n=2 Tax=Fervidobacterium TaxID=2422 RepID=A0AAI8CLB0_FERIS|nr:MULTISPECIES: Asp23/Gls24 family envelope stress response protein [Fervidobacterium]AMW32597.1 Asp23/Gls24 family envelope stress response protein [Fervidobacterium islandicum]QAV32549.1 Asp23/Gls24 family envelope stress response protein [Fervidobacterium changbaicum]SDH85435.1 Uncharacterized conserved protein YloU, alkaline shock protein (Asp23) family [Fervidobacterium changbaicum]